MLINYSFFADSATQEIVLMLSITTLIILFLFFAWKLIKKQIINYKRLNFLEKRQTSANSKHIGTETDNKSEVIEETDLIEEAKIFATYGRFDQAITILQWQIKAFPKKMVPYSELFIIYIHLEDERAYSKLLKSLPFDKNSTEFQGALANGLLTFPDNDELNKLSNKNGIHNKIEKEPNLSVESNATVQSSTVKAQEMALKKQSNTTVNNEIKKAKYLTKKKPNKEKDSADKLLVLSNKKFTIQHLSSLERSIFFAFDNKCQLAVTLQKQKQTYKNSKNKNMEKIIKNKLLLINIHIQHSENKTASDTDLLEQKAEQMIMNQFNELLAIQKYVKGARLLESHLKHNPLLDIFYPMLLQIYIEFKMLEDYYNFRQFIFSHAIQPSIDIILLINDTENKIKTTQLEPLQVA